MYTVGFEIAGGTPPFTIITGGGTMINDSMYLSAEMPRNTIFEVIIEDLYGCQIPIVTGTESCICESIAGTMSKDTIDLCEDGIAVSTYDDSFQFYEQDDTTSFVLHTSNRDTLGEIIGINSSGQFTFDINTMNIGFIYYISGIVGDNFQGLVNINDGCLDIALGQPVIWQRPPDFIDINCLRQEGEIMLSWPEDETVSEYEIFFNGISQVVLQNNEYNSVDSFDATLEISIISRSATCDDVISFANCVDELNECEAQLTNDVFLIDPSMQNSINILLNDVISEDEWDYLIFDISPQIVYVDSLSKNGLLHLRVIENMVDTVSLRYRICFEDCTECSEATVRLYNKLLENIQKTNFISPNEDGRNDALRFNRDELIADSKLSIFNRWGDLIYQATEYDNSWTADGYPGGVYYYVLEIKNTVIKSSLTVVR